MTPLREPTERERLRRIRKQASRDLRAIVERREQEQAEHDRAVLDGILTVLSATQPEPADG